MSRMPKWMGDAMESLIASRMLHLTVTEVEYLSREVKKICFKGDLSRAGFSIGNALSFRVSALDHRNYTPVVFDPANGICEIIFHIHGNGPGSTFADKLQVGDATKVIPPRGKKMYRNDSDFHFFFGDESSIGTCQSLMLKGNCAGILELDEVNLEVPEKLGMAAEIVIKHSGLFAAALDTYALHSGTTFVLTGKTTSIQSFRKLLKERGVSNSQIITEAYWAPGKKGL